MHALADELGIDIDQLPGGRPGGGAVVRVRRGIVRFIGVTMDRYNRW